MNVTSVKIGAGNIRVGDLLEYNSKLWLVQKTQHTQPGKGGAYMQVEMKDIIVGTKQNIRFRTAETVDKARLEQKEYQYLYSEGDSIALMDKESYEQVSLSNELVGEQLAFLQDGIDVMVEFYGEKAIAVVLPTQMTFAIAECEPVVKGQTAASSYKPAVLENGVRIMVPPFINVGDKVVVNTAEQEYVERAKD